MHDRDLWDTITRAITAATGRAFSIRTQSAIGGGCINTACRVADGNTSYFVKLNDPGMGAMFAAEFAGLEELRQAGAVRVPAPVCHGASTRAAYLVLEYLDLGSCGTPGYEALGRQLAAQHRTTRPRYGFHMDNTIGSTAQPNGPGADWASFWRTHRLGHQLELAAANGYRGRLQERGARLLEALPALLAGHNPPAALLHGDLWSGNCACTRAGAPVIFDPAVYYGDREADLAMTELFGGFPRSFYQAYEEAFPLPPGYPVRRTLYNLYHVLNHLNLFGGGYRGQAEGMMDALLAEPG